MVVRTDLSGTALSMVAKEGITIFGALCEWITKEAIRGHGAGRRFNVRTAKLVEMTVISVKLKEELDWIWEVRCNTHLEAIDGLEHDMYSRQDYNRALKAYQDFRDILVLKDL